MLCSMETLYAKNRQRMEDLVPFNYYTYILVQKNCNLHSLKSKFPDFIDKTMGAILKASGVKIEFFLQPLEKIHLHSNLEYDTGNSDIKYVYIFSAIAGFILLIAIINFMNLATARSVNRSKEVGIRKVLGSSRGCLVNQFLTESTLYSVISLIISILLAKLAAPLLRSVSGSNFELNFSQFPWLLPVFILLALFTGFTAGCYPAFFLSAFRPIQVLRSRVTKENRSITFRNTLVVVQFTISIILILGTVIINRQLSYMKNTGLGFDKERVAVISIRNSNVMKTAEAFKNRLSNYTGISTVGISSHVPGLTPFVEPVFPEGGIEGQSQLLRTMDIDYEFIPAMGLLISEGRNFSRDHTSDPDNSVIINEAAALQFGWDDPVGKKLQFLQGSDMQSRNSKTVIAVVEDFHTMSLHNVIEPLFFSCMGTAHNRYISVRINQGRLSDTMEFMQKCWGEVDPERPFTYSFLDQTFDSQYRTEENLSDIFSYFTVFALVIACLGLFGLVSFVAEQRTKEIGIRKVLGANVFQLVFMCSGKRIC